MSVAEGIRKFIKSVIILFYYKKTFKPSHHLAIRLKAYEKRTGRYCPGSQCDPHCCTDSRDIELFFVIYKISLSLSRNASSPKVLILKKVA